MFNIQTRYFNYSIFIKTLWSMRSLSDQIDANYIVRAIICVSLRNWTHFIKVSLMHNVTLIIVCLHNIGRPISCYSYLMENFFFICRDIIYCQ